MKHEKWIVKYVLVKMGINQPASELDDGLRNPIMQAPIRWSFKV